MEMKKANETIYEMPQLSTDWVLILWLHFWYLYYDIPRTIRYVIALISQDLNAKIILQVEVIVSTY